MLGKIINEHTEYKCNWTSCACLEGERKWGWLKERDKNVCLYVVACVRERERKPGLKSVMNLQILNTTQEVNALMGSSSNDNNYNSRTPIPDDMCRIFQSHATSTPVWAYRRRQISIWISNDIWTLLSCRTGRILTSQPLATNRCDTDPRTCKIAARITRPVLR